MITTRHLMTNQKLERWPGALGQFLELSYALEPERPKALWAVRERLVSEQF